MFARASGHTFGTSTQGLLRLRMRSRLYHESSKHSTLSMRQSRPAIKTSRALIASHKTAVPKHVANLWHNINSSLQDCHRLVEDLEQLVKAVIGKKKSDSGFRLASNLETFRKQLRKHSREVDFDKLYGRLNTFQNTLQLMLDLVVLWVLVSYAPGLQR